MLLIEIHVDLSSRQCAVLKRSAHQTALFATLRRQAWESFSFRLRVSSSRRQILAATNHFTFVDTTEGDC